MADDWNQWRARVDVTGYDQRWERMAAAGENPHGEADLVSSFHPNTVLDGGCGTGRVAIELARRGIDVIGADLDGDMLAVAREKAPELRWVHTDLAELDLGHPVALVVLAGNVIPYVAVDRRRATVARCAAALVSGGHLIAGFQLARGWPTLDEYDAWCAESGLTLAARWSTWDRAPFDPADRYAVSVHRSTAGVTS